MYIIIMFICLYICLYLSLRTWTWHWMVSNVGGLWRPKWNFEKYGRTLIYILTTMFSILFFIYRDFLYFSIYVFIVVCCKCIMCGKVFKCRCRITWLQEYNYIQFYLLQIEHRIKQYYVNTKNKWLCFAGIC